MNELIPTQPAALVTAPAAVAADAEWIVAPDLNVADLAGGMRISGPSASAPAVRAVLIRPVPIKRCPLLRRMVAHAIDALVPLPFLVPVLPPWAIVCVGYALFCDCRGASVGKKLMGLSVVCVSPSPNRWGKPCNAGRSLLRNGGLCLTGLGFATAWLAPIALSLLLIEVLTTVFHKQGRRIGDLLAGTQVIARETTKETV